MSAETRLTELKLELPPAPKPAGVYKPVVIAGNMAYVSGHLRLSDYLQVPHVVGASELTVVCAAVAMS